MLLMDRFWDVIFHTQVSGLELYSGYVPLEGHSELKYTVESQHQLVLVVIWI